MKIWIEWLAWAIFLYQEVTTMQVAIYFACGSLVTIFCTCKLLTKDKLSWSFIISEF